MTERQWAIYTLSDPRTPDVVRYVGVTHDKPSNRLARHVSCARKRAVYHSSKWVRSLLLERLTPEMRIVQQGSGAGWEDAERCWIALHRAQGSPLTNHAEGGRGPLGCARSPETREKLAAANRGKKQNPELIEKRISAIRGKTHTAASRANMSAGSKGKPWTATETAAHAPVRSDPEWRARVSQSNKETYARRKAAGQGRTRKGQEVSEATRERLRLAHLGKTQSEETKAKRSASLRAAWARKKAEGVA